MLDLEDLLALLAVHAGELLLDLAADHVGDDVGHVHVREVALGDELAVAHDRHAVHDVLQLLQAVGDVHDALALGAQTADDAEQLVDLLGGQRRGGLVHDEDAGVGGQRLGDLHHLLLGHLQGADHRGGIQLDVQALEHPRGLGVHLLLGELQAPAALAAQEHVLRHRQVLAHVQLLMDDGHAQLLRALGVHVVDLLTEDLHRAGVLVVNAGEHLHQRRLACAVFTQQRHDLARLQMKVNVVQRLYAGKTFAYVFQFDDVLALVLLHLIPPLCSLSLYTSGFLMHTIITLPQISVNKGTWVLIKLRMTKV